MRALIIGGLGYIGSGLIEYYRSLGGNGIEVDILDKRFVPHVVTGLPDNFRFVQGDMKKSASLDPLLAKRPDVVYLLAAEVQAESSINRETAIWENNFEATVKVIEKCPREARLVFASTGNVFGGIDESQKYMDLTEDDAPRPKYPYAESKCAVEKYLLDSKKNYVICRFGTNYGYTPGIRFNLVTNNFIKKALEGGTITVHGKGENFRPTVCVKDAVRAMLFLSERKDVEGQIYHVVCENFRIKDLARHISGIGRSCKIEYIAKTIPFSSYNLSSMKIRSLGFEFEWNLQRAMESMVEQFDCLRRSP